MTDRDRLIQFCRQQIGKPYILGDIGPDSFDCSGLIYSGLMMLTSEDIPRISTDQFTLGTSIPLSQIRPGDLIFFDTGWTNRKPNHLGICVGNGKMINANRYNNQVIEESYQNNYWQNKIYGIRRIFNEQNSCELQPDGNSDTDMPDNFADVPGSHPDHEFITELQQQGIVKGFPGNLFKPNQPVTRAEALKIILLAFKIPVVDAAASSFTDVHTTDWHISIIETAKNKGIINGYQDNTFRPGNSINRAEICKIIVVTGNTDAAQPPTDPYADVHKDAWFSPYAAIAKSRAMFQIDDTNFYPAKPVTRAEMCRAIVQFLRGQDD